MANNYWYTFECDYGNRVKERQFIKDILNEFDRNYATMVGVFANNNPYSLEFFIGVNLQGDPILFKNWLKGNYPEKYRMVNIFLEDLSRYNGQTFANTDMVDSVLTSDGGGHPFHWIEQEKLESAKPQYKATKRNSVKVFLSHSSMDKENIVNPIFDYLQANNIATWIDNSEIDYGDDIFFKVNDGLENCDIGLFILTEHFFDRDRSGWPQHEFSTFFMEKMKGKKKILIVNAGVSHDKLPVSMKPYKYLEWTGLESLNEIGNAIKRKLALIS